MQRLGKDLELIDEKPRSIKNTLPVPILFFQSKTNEFEELRNVVRYVHDKIMGSLDTIPTGIKKMYAEIYKNNLAPNLIFENIKKIALYYSGRRSILYLLTSAHKYNEDAEMLYRIFKEAASLHELSKSHAYHLLKSERDEACFFKGIPTMDP